MRANIKKMLESLGHTITGEGGTGYEGIKAYKLFKPDIVIIDMVENGVNALDVLDYIRNQANDSDAYILVLIPSSKGDLKDRVLNEGADDFILKPFSLGGEEIISRLNVAKRHVILYKQLLIAYNRLSKEFDTVSMLQQKLLPKGGLNFPYVSVDFFYQPSGRASGDYFDFFSINEDVLRTVIADVSGHGARAAFVMSMVRALVRASDVTLLSLEQIVELINKELIEVIGEDMDFVTLFRADIDIKNKQLYYINAGHCPGILVSKDNNIELLNADFSVLGFFTQKFTLKSFPLKDKKGLLLYTDGYYE
jgi:sigma-B regulation protein RsbU (phosphoserine phosphatase)